jgi:hypothetical protein
MSLRETLSLLSTHITEKMNADPKFIISETNWIKQLCERYGHIFLIICDDIPGRNGTYYSLHSRSELRMRTIPPGMFTRPNRTINFHVLTKPVRKFILLAGLGML